MSFSSPRNSASSLHVIFLIVGTLVVTTTLGCERKVRLRVRVQVADTGTATSSVAHP